MSVVTHFETCDFLFSSGCSKIRAPVFLLVSSSQAHLKEKMEKLEKMEIPTEIHLLSNASLRSMI